VVERFKFPFNFFWLNFYIKLDCSLRFIRQYCRPFWRQWLVACFYGLVSKLQGVLYYFCHGLLRTGCQDKSIALPNFFIVYFTFFVFDFLGRNICQFCIKKTIRTRPTSFFDIFTTKKPSSCKYFRSVNFYNYKQNLIKIIF